jgi:hypothetical protein
LTIDVSIAARMGEHAELIAIPEHLNRCSPVTDKWRRAWQKQMSRCKQERRFAVSLS